MEKIKNKKIDKDGLLMDSLVDVYWLKENIDHPNLRVLECSVIVKKNEDDSMLFVSGKENWEKGHITGSGFVDLIEGLSDTSKSLPFTRPSVEQFSKEMGNLGVGPETKVVLYDRGGYNNMWATRVWWMLRAYGFDAVAVLDGGWKAWDNANLPIETEISEYPVATFKATPREEMFVDTPEVLETLNEESALLIDAMTPRIYFGELERFERPGHILGAINLPIEGIIDSTTNQFTNEDNVRNRLTAIVGHPGQKIISYCGRGMRSTVNAFYLYRLGYKNISVYDGSLAEWSADESLPMTTVFLNN
jgi:thiosulfate/3-mercaptopyruvate sulfurtransferase